MNVCESYTTLTSEEIKATTRFMEILLNVQERVSCHQLTSINSEYANAKGFLDKIEFYHDYGIDLELIKSKCDEFGFKYNSKNLADRKLYFEVSDKDRKIHFLQNHPNNTNLKKLFLNPSHYSNVSALFAFLNQLIGTEALNLNISRIDFTIDLPVEYKTLLKGLEIKHKRANSEYSNGSNRTGLVIGSQNDKIKIYDKAAKLNLKIPLTRIERQIRGSSLVIRKSSELQGSLDRLLNFNPFDGINLNYINFIDGECKTSEQLNRLSELKALVEHEGFYLAKKKLNKSDNFHRDFGKFFKLSPYELIPNEIFRKDIINYFKGDV